MTDALGNGERVAIACERQSHLREAAEIGELSKIEAQAVWQAYNLWMRRGYPLIAIRALGKLQIF